ncbi:prepilin-type N-terminal cleavage/methylation domain-containing protein [Bradyrhizobium sp. Cp5.3]|uniref:prepilin-type N-terminal cleavage/methylation domain-containing protein n=1 Tax=Bradyrhizobium sp. Cp5.3 TaxID=443598 RepID=UPI000A00CDBB|nr:prepilin-type N-terminal cleavage/methylation domain-containing protein [Bradyrhizobium sp. Cp5.3]
MVRKVGREPLAISRRRRSSLDSGEAGFTLLEMVCVLGIMALLVAISLPRIPVATSRPKLEAYAIQIATLLKADRNAAMGRRLSLGAVVDAPGRTVRAGSSAGFVKVPDDVVFDALLPQRCNGREVPSTITFLPSGMSCGGAIRLTRFGSGFDLRVNWLTGGVDIVAQDAVQAEQ